MNAVTGIIFFLLSLIANCHLFPLTEFDIEFQEITKLERSYQHCPINCQEKMESECQCLNFQHPMNCTEVIEHGLHKLNLVCNSSDTGTHKTCRFLERLKNLVNTDQSLCWTPVSLKQILNYTKTMYQRSNSIPTS